jgi:hypothetical protein
VFLLPMYHVPQVVVLPYTYRTDDPTQGHRVSKCGFEGFVDVESI